MKRLLLTISILIMYALGSFVQPSEAQQNPQSQTTIRDSYNGEAITVADTAIGFTASLINPTCTDCPINVLRATLATCTLETANIRVRSDGTDPTASVGLLIQSGQSFEVYGYSNISSFRAIRTTGDSGSLFCEYSRIP